MNDTKPVEEETYVYLIIVHSVHCQDVILSFVLLHLLIKVVNIHTCFDMRGGGPLAYLARPYATCIACM